MRATKADVPTGSKPKGLPSSPSSATTAPSATKALDKQPKPVVIHSTVAPVFAPLNAAVNTGSAAEPCDASHPQFGYEVGFSQVRSFQIADINTVRKALNDNISELLATETGIRRSYLLQNVRMALGLIAIACGFFSHWNPYPFPENYNIMLGCILGYYVTCVAMYCSFRWIEGDAFFLGYCAGGAAGGGSGKGTSSGGNRKGSGGAAGSAGAAGSKMLRLSAVAVMTDPVYTLTAEVVRLRHWWIPAAIETSESVTFSPGAFFTQDGQIYPPPVRGAVSKLLSDLKLM